MTRVFSEFYIFISKLKRTYQLFETNTNMRDMLIAKINILLNNYNENKWQLLKNNFFEFCKFYSYDEDYIDCQLIYLIILDILQEKINDFNSDYIDAIVQAFAYNDANPFNYKRYLDLLLNNEIMFLIMELDELATPIAYVIIAIIENNDIDTLEKNNYAYVKNIINRIKGVYPSPIFKGNYNFFNMYSCLKRYMNKLNTNNNFFTMSDYQSIKFLVDMDQHLSIEEKDNFILTIKEIEKDYDMDKRYLIKEIIKKINKYYNYPKTQNTLSLTKRKR